MHVCLCNNFNEKAVETALTKEPEARKSPLALYKACTDGKKPSCRKCLPTLAEMLAQAKQTLPPG